MNIIYGCEGCGNVEIVPEGLETALAGICEECKGLMKIMGWMEDNVS
jgi:hypothetical protein